MHADLMLLYICSILDYDFHEEIAKSWAQLLSILLPFSFRGHPGLAKHHIVWASANHQYILSIRFLLTGLCDLDSN